MAKKKTTRKVKKKAVEQKEEDYFVGFDDPVELRRHILEPTREVIQFLQSYEEFKKGQVEKTNTILQLKGELKEIKTDINKLKRLLPKSKVKAERTAQRVKEEIKKEQKVAVEEKPKPMARPATELDALEKELGDIEKKLGTISE